MENLSRTDSTETSLRRAGAGLATLRIGLGVVWALNLIYVVDPRNDFFASFASTAAGFSTTSLGGGLIPDFVAAHSLGFALAIAGVTGYLAVALILGVTTRWACLAGFVFNAVLFVTQVGQILVLPGGTDVGPQPLYLVAYLALLAAGPEQRYSLDRWWRAQHRPTPRTSRDRTAAA